MPSLKPWTSAWLFLTATPTMRKSNVFTYVLSHFVLSLLVSSGLISVAPVYSLS